MSPRKTEARARWEILAVLAWWEVAEEGIRDECAKAKEAGQHGFAFHLESGPGGTDADLFAVLDQNEGSGQWVELLLAHRTAHLFQSLEIKTRKGFHAHAYTVHIQFREE